MPFPLEGSFFFWLKSSLALAVLLFFIGLFGAIFSASNFERYNRSKGQAKAYRKQLEDNLSIEFPGTKSVSEIKQIANVETAESHRILSKFSDDDDKKYKRLLSVHSLWVILPLLIALIGFILIILCSFEVGVTANKAPLLIRQIK